MQSVPEQQQQRILKEGATAIGFQEFGSKVGLEILGRENCIKNLLLEILGKKADGSVEKHLDTSLSVLITWKHLPKAASLGEPGGCRSAAARSGEHLELRTRTHARRCILSRRVAPGCEYSRIRGCAGILCTYLCVICVANPHPCCTKCLV